MACRMRKYGFTLIELLVVIAIIALLLSIIMPALRRVKEQGKRAVCLANLKSLTLSWTLYADDHDGKISACAATGFWGIENGWVSAVNDDSGNPSKKPIEQSDDRQLEAIRDGVLFPYNEAEGIYRCLTAKPNELRSYSCSPGMRGLPDSDPPQSINKISQIRNTGRRIVFFDDYGNNWDAMWMISRTEARWWNPIPMRHGKGTTLSFADAHAEWWDWKDPRTIEWASIESWEEAAAARSSIPLQPDNEDLVGVKMGVYGKVEN